MTRQTHPVRVIVAVLTLLVALGLGWAVNAVFSLPSERLGWLWSAMVWMVLLGLPVLVLWPLRPRRWVGAITVIALLIGLGSWYTAPPTHERIHAAYDAEVDLPDEFVETDRDERGNTWCFKGCPAVTVHYSTPTEWPPQERSRRFADALAEDGWTSHTDHGTSSVIYSKGRWQLRRSGAFDEPTFSVGVGG